MSDFHVSLRRTKPDTESGFTDFTVTLGYMDWHITLQEMAELFYPDALAELCHLKVGDSCDISLSGHIVKKKLEPV